MRCEECGTALFEAGDVVPAGDYLRVDDGSFSRIAMARRGPIPASFDGHVAEYRSAGAVCACRHRDQEQRPPEQRQETGQSL